MKYDDIIRFESSRLIFTVRQRGDVKGIPAWNLYGNSDRPRLELCRPLLMRFYRRSGIIDQYYINAGFTWDSGSRPNLVPDALVNDHGHLGTMLKFLKHDIDYTIHPRSRAYADRDLIVLAKLTGQSFISRHAEHKGVRLGGGSFGKVLSKIGIMDKFEGPSKWYKPAWVLEQRPKQLIHFYRIYDTSIILPGVQNLDPLYYWGK